LLPIDSGGMRDRESLGFGRLADGGIAIIHPASVPNGATAIAQNLTVAASAGASFVTTFPSGARSLIRARA
jgi:hypothetical protein